jgi:hypothetical protein
MKYCSYLFLIAFQLLAYNRVSAQKTQIQYLSGTGNDQTVKWNFFCTAGMKSGKWTQIPVPSNWELQGFGKYDYGFSKDSLRGKEQGLYKYTFKVPANWKGKTINIVFEGSMTDTEVKINGKSAGPIHQGAFYVFKYDVTGLLKYDGDNLLEATVSKQSKDQSVNEAERKADFWIFGGIFRPVFLECLPLQHIERISTDAKANGDFKANVTLVGAADRVEMEVFDVKGKRVGKKLKSERPAVSTNNSSNTSVTNTIISGAFPEVKPWSPEFPNLYTVTFNLIQGNKIKHTLSKKIGFRTIELKPRDGMYVNGAKIKFKGVNRHSFYPTSGRTTSKKISIADVSLMKEMNMNAVRMSHYPPDGHCLDVCDSLGLFVMDELAGWHGNYSTSTGAKLLKEMIVNDENHPSIVFWANGNEGGHNRELDPLFAMNDVQKRPVIHPWEIFGGFETTHYREYNYGIGNYDLGHNIVMPTEFLHGMFDGGHGAGIEDYWKAMWNNPLSAGGFLWDFADQGVVRTDKNGEIDTDGNHGPDGIVGPNHEKEGSFFTIKEVWSPIYFERREITPAFDGTFTVENRYSFANLNQCAFQWKLKKLESPGVDAMYKNGSFASLDLKPLEKGTIKMTLPADWQKFDVLYVTALGPDQKEVFTWSFPILMPETKAAELVVKDGSTPAAIKETASTYEVSANGINLSFAKSTGILLKVSNAKGVIPFNNGPILQEGVNNFKEIKYRKEGQNIIISSTYNKKESFNTLEWVIYPSGWVKMQVNYFPDAYFTTFVGVNFSYPEQNIKGVEYLGNGPYRVWKNRMKGNQFGIWNKEYNNSATGEIPFNYPEFKGYFSNLYWCKFIGKDQSFKVVTDQEDIFLRLFTPKKSKDTEYDNLNPTFPKGDISFMNGISGIGTKTQKPETTGPMGMKHVYYDYDKEPSRALKMTLYFDFSGNIK